MALTLFSWIDYTVFTIIIGLGCAVGIYFGFNGKQTTAEDYLFGGKKMKWFPISVSLISSVLSGMSLLGLPTEIYLYGTQITILVAATLISGWITHAIYLPVFYDLQLTSVYDYLQLRFHRHVKNTISFLACTTGIFCMPLGIYVPSLIFEQVSGVDFHVIASIMTLLCIFYTAVGGMKAVVWADTLQFSVTVITLTIVITIGLTSIGGFGVVIDRATLGERLEFFNFSFDPTIRCTFWSALIGNIFSWTALFSVSPVAVQRFVSLPTKRTAKSVLLIFTIGIVSAKMICFILGLIIYARYYDCDPKSLGEIKKADQIVPYFIIEITAGLKGLIGLFAAAFFGAAFSNLSTSLNTLAGIIYTDLAHLFMPKKLLKEKPGIILKLFTLIIGISSIGLLYLLENVGTIFEVLYYIKGITDGAVLGIFTLGLVFPMANTKGAVTGGLVSLVLMTVIIIRNQMYLWSGAIKYETKPLHTYGCNVTDNEINEYTTLATPVNTEEPFWLFRITFQYYYMIGTITTIIIGLLVSWLTKKDTDLEVDPEYLCSFVHKLKCSSRSKSIQLQKETKPLKDKHIF